MLSSLRSTPRRVCVQLVVFCCLALAGCLGSVEDEGVNDQSALAVTSQPHGQPAYMPRSKRFSLRVKDTDDGAWKPVDVIADVNGYDYAQLSLAGGACDIEVTAASLGSIGNYSISPIREGFVGSVSGNKLTYRIPSERNSIVWISGINEKLIVAVDPVHTPPPSSGEHVFNVLSRVGVRNDRSNIANTTQGFQEAIELASAYAGSQNGGRGIVYVPAGAYAVGNLTLKSDVELYLAEGSALFFASNVANDVWNYTYSTDWTTKGNGTRWIRTASEASHIRIWGAGTLDGNAKGAGGFMT